MLDDLHSFGLKVAQDFSVNNEYSNCYLQSSSTKITTKSHTKINDVNEVRKLKNYWKNWWFTSAHRFSYSVEFSSKNVSRMPQLPIIFDLFIFSFFPWKIREKKKNRLYRWELTASSNEACATSKERSKMITNVMKNDPKNYISVCVVSILSRYFGRWKYWMLQRKTIYIDVPTRWIL